LITNFNLLDYSQRRSEVGRLRVARLLNLQRTGSSRYQIEKKFFSKTTDYIHLSRDERINCVKEIANCIGNWGYARLFAECIDKTYFDPLRAPATIDVQAFEQVVSGLSNI
jgi:hypothetical protein